MASLPHTTSRRGILGALAAASAAATLTGTAAQPAFAQSDQIMRRRWDAAMDRHLRAKVACDSMWAHYVQIDNPTAEQHEKMDRASSEYCETEDVLLALPAPDLQAVNWKMELILKPNDDGHTEQWLYRFVVPALDDLRRLAGRMH